MSVTLRRPSELAAADASPSTLVKVLLSCGIAHAALYVVANDVVAAAIYSGYSRVTQAVSELSAIGSPAKPFLNATLPLFTVLIVAFGVGVWMSAAGRRALRVTGALLVATGVTGIAWLWFPMTSRAAMVKGTMATNDVGHVGMTILTVALILAMIAFSAAAFGGWFRLYAIATDVVVLVFGAFTGTQTSALAAGKPTPWMGLSERVNIGAWLLWMAVLAVVLLRGRAVSAAANGGGDTNLTLVEPPSVARPA